MNEDPRREPGLFDLPLEGPPPVQPDLHEERRLVESRVARSERSRTLPLFEVEGEPEEPPGEPSPADSRIESALRGRPVAVPGPPAEPRTAPLRRRVLGAAGNLVILAGAAILATTGAAAMGAGPSVERVPALLLFVLSFSFLYSVVPLAFWGSTPGMIWAGLVARSGANEPLSFGQTALRWLAGWLTCASFGLLGLLALTGRSLADRLSGSRTYELVVSP